jgi:hypothetical protein
VELFGGVVEQGILCGIGGASGEFDLGAVTSEEPPRRAEDVVEDEHPSPRAA